MRDFEEELSLGKVLIVDDEKDICFLLKTIIRREYPGTAIYTANSVAQGTSLMKENIFDVYLFDFNLGDGTGLDLIKAARSGGNQPYIVVISAYSAAKDLSRLEENGVERFVSKPISKEKLFEQINKKS